MLVPFCDIASNSLGIDEDPGCTSLVEIMSTSYRFPKSKSWVLLGPTAIVVPRGFSCLLLRESDKTITLDRAIRNNSHLSDLTPVLVPREKWFQVLHTTPIAELRQTVAASQDGPDPIAVIAVVRILGNLASCVGMVEAGEILDYRG